jgi:acid phosphatase class B
MAPAHAVALALVGLLALPIARGAIAQQPPPLQQRPASQGPEPQKLTAQQLAQSLSGNSTVVQMPSGGGRPPVTVTIFYDPNGTVLFSSSDGTVDQGIWRVTPDGKYCSRWQRLRKGFESCADVLRAGEILHFVENSSEFVTRLVAGNVLRQTRR